LWISRPAEALLVNNQDGTVDLGLFEADPYIRPGERYQVRAALSSLTVAELRAAGSDYPDWVVDRYLQLPEEITPRTRQLAQQIAAGLDNPYDIAEAITNYLRTNIQYADLVPDLPSGQERVDWFLFDLRQGFCNYYATAEVVLLRSLGLPARIAVGFAQGERQTEILRVITPGAEEGPIPPPSESEIATFIVRQKDAHAWPEVYFPGIGWVEFEPTTSQSPLLRPQGLELDNDAQPDPPQRSEEEDSNLPGDLYPGPQDAAGSAQAGPALTVRTVVLLALLAASAVLLFTVVWKVRRGLRVIPTLEGWAVRIPGQIEKGLLRLGIQPPEFIRNWTQYAALPALTRAYLEVNRALRRLGQSPAPQDTPAERVAALSTSLPPAARGWPLAGAVSCRRLQPASG
jgi:transglutaminase-like putative cysteine protease